MKHLDCTGPCKKKIKASNKRFAKLIAEAGSEENLRKDYKCRSCRPKKK